MTEEVEKRRPGAPTPRLIPYPLRKNNEDGERKVLTRLHSRQQFFR